jgi:hypothetical protein
MLLLVAAGAATASPVPYNFTSGSVTVSAFAGTTSLIASGNVISLTGNQVTFDSAVPSVPSFSFAAAGPSTTTFNTGLPGVLSALSGDQLILSNVTVSPGSGYTSSGSGTGPNYAVTLFNLTASGSYVLKNSTGTITLASGNFTGNTASLTGQVLLGGSGNSQLALNGISLGAITLSGQTVLLKGDVLFNGVAPVPVPAGVWLLGAGIAGLSRFSRRRRTSSPAVLH